MTLTAEQTSAVELVHRHGWMFYGESDDSGPYVRSLRAAIELADPDDMAAPRHVFEAAKRTGLIATCEKRRMDARAAFTELMGTLTPKVAKAFATTTFVDATIRSLRAAGLMEAIDHTYSMEAVATQLTLRRDKTKAAAIAALRALLKKQAKLSAQWKALAAEARAAGMAEGYAEGTALVHLKLGLAPVDMDTLYDRTIENLRTLTDYWSQADSWVTAEISGMAGDIGAAIADAISSNAGRQAMIDAVNDVIDKGDGAAFYMDEAIHTATVQAALSIYSDAGIGQIDFQTEDDDRVCPICQGYEDDNPHEIDQVPAPPIHGKCRCMLIPVSAGV